MFFSPCFLVGGVVLFSPPINSPFRSVYTFSSPGCQRTLVHRPESGVYVLQAAVFVYASRRMSGRHARALFERPGITFPLRGMCERRQQVFPFSGTAIYSKQLFAHVREKQAPAGR